MVEVTGNNTTLWFKVTKQAPVLVPPFEPTPYEIKQFFDIEDQPSHHDRTPVILFYGNDEHTGGVALRGQDPVKMIKEAVAKALVPYYPLAGRLRECDGKKVVVECNGEGILFIEADADASLEDFDEPLHPPFPCIEELLYHAPGFSGVLDTPLLLIQVTRLKCGGFTLAALHNHAIGGGASIARFMNAVADLARGVESVAANPAWERYLLPARVPARATCMHHEYDDMKDVEMSGFPLRNNLVHRSFFFGPHEIASLQRSLPPHLKSSTRYEILTAYLWKCQTIAATHDPTEIVRVIFSVNAISKFNPPLPTGCSDNVVAYPLAETTAGKLASNSLGYAVELIKKAKAEVTNLPVIEGRRPIVKLNTFKVCDHTRVGFDELDFGWGLPVYAGPVKFKCVDDPELRSNYVAMMNCLGGHGILCYVRLPPQSMDRFAKKLNRTFINVSNHHGPNISSSL